MSTIRSLTKPTTPTTQRSTPSSPLESLRTTQTLLRQMTATKAQVAAPRQDGFETTRAAPMALAETQARPFKEVLPGQAAETPAEGATLSEAALDRVLNHLESSIGRKLTPNERNVWKNEARELSKKGGSEDIVWGQAFTKFHSAQQNTGRGVDVLPGAAAETPAEGASLSEAALDRVLNHLESSVGRKLTPREREVWKNEARELSKKGGSEDLIWGQAFTKFHSAQQNTGRGVDVLPGAAAETPAEGATLSEAALDRVLNHLESSVGRKLTPREREVWKNEARELSKKGGSEDLIWGQAFTKFHSAQQNTGRGVDVLPGAVAETPAEGATLSEAALDRVLNHLESSVGRKLTPREREVWKNEARELSKKGGSEDLIWGQAFTKFHSAQQNTGRGVDVLPGAAAETPAEGATLSEAALDRVLNHLESSVGRKLTPREREVWKNEARELSKKGGSEDLIWGQAFTKFHSAQQNTGRGVDVLPGAAAETPAEGATLSEAALDRVLNHLESSVGRKLTPREREVWKNEARELSKKGGSEDLIWGQLFTKFHSAERNG
ncbi:hypothetical protein [Hyalangium gracile]|uniref:hypothetical protein n=1 Tax=Hyalangium gracile TaxID=394092 RepID=UPI001CCD5AD7|nr:hypothetical protein [Hyalangium gracile]